MLQGHIVRNMRKPTKVQYGVVAGFIAILICVWIWTSLVKNREITDLTEDVCGYDITDTGDDLVPSVNGERIGTFERHGDGTVQLTLGSGFSPKANACIEKAGLGERISTIRKYR